LFKKKKKIKYKCSLKSHLLQSCEKLQSKKQVERMRKRRRKRRRGNK